jgi:hypothetical protein
MRFSKLIESKGNYMAQLANDLNAYFVRLKASGVFTIDTAVMANELEALGYTITPEALVDALTTNQHVANADATTIELVGSNTSPDADAETNRKAVHNLAVKAAKKGIK